MYKGRASQIDREYLNFCFRKFWLPEGASLVESSRTLGTLKDQHFTEAIETLQMLSTSFSPRDKLNLIHRTFQLVSKARPQWLVTV